MRRTKFKRDKLESGMWIHVRSNWWLGTGIRFALNKWEKRVCKKLDLPFVKVWGNHDGIVLTPNVFHDGSPYGIGEALAEGSVLTPLEKYEKDMASGHLDVRVFSVVPRDGEDPLKIMWQAANNWELSVDNHGYDYWSYVGLILKSFLNLNVPTGCRERFWCTEGVEDSFTEAPPGYSVLQDTTPTPMHVEQAAGLIPRPSGRKITLREVTEEVMC